MPFNIPSLSHLNTSLSAAPLTVIQLGIGRSTWTARSHLSAFTRLAFDCGRRETPAGTNFWRATIRARSVAAAILRALYWSAMEFLCQDLVWAGISAQHSGKVLMRARLPTGGA